MKQPKYYKNSSMLSLKKNYFNFNFLFNFHNLIIICKMILSFDFDFSLYIKLKDSNKVVFIEKKEFE